MSLLNELKTTIKNSGSNKSKILYIRDGDKKRIRFLEDLEEGHEIIFHDSFENNINVPCQEIYGRDCPYCGSDEVRTRKLFAWSIWDYEANEVKILLYAVNNYTPIPQLVNFYEAYGTLVDRDYMLSVTGKQQNKTFGVVPMDVVKFRNTKAKPLSEKALLKTIDKAFPCDEAADGNEDERDYKYSKTKARKQDIVDESEEDWENEDVDYEDMTSKELYKLCKERDISCKPYKSGSYYIKLLKEADEDGEDDWQDEDSNYDDMQPKELYNLCVERGIECKPKKIAKYYINLLEEDDRVNAEWADEEGEEDEEW